jgi:hypothetical protein
MVTRFNNTTWKELTDYKQKHGITGAIYGTPCRIIETIPLKAKLIVLEMNNDTNTIMGVGIIHNLIRMDKYHAIYSSGNFNRFTYTGKHYISASDFTREQVTLIEKMELCVFKGKGHLKRGQGIQTIPNKRYNKDDIEVFKQMFRVV